MKAKERPDRFNQRFAKKNWRTKQLQEFFKVPSSLKEGDNTNKETITKKAFVDFLTENSLFVFSFVRHPFERLVSAYKDKVLRGGCKKMYGAEREYFDRHKSFPDFIRFVSKQHKNNSVVNGHWNLLSQNCQHCSIPYNVVGKLETFDEDVNYIILKNGLEHILPVENAKKVKLNTTSRKSKTNKKKESLTYFSKLTKEQIKELYQIYKIDFEMFGYEASDYLLLP